MLASQFPEMQQQQFSPQFSPQQPQPQFSLPSRPPYHTNNPFLQHINNPQQSTNTDVEIRVLKEKINMLMEMLQEKDKQITMILQNQAKPEHPHIPRNKPYNKQFNNNKQ